MKYNKTTWISQKTPLSAENLNKIEEGIVNNVVQVESIDVASKELLNKVVQYIGPTTEDYINGYFYKCVVNNKEYSWENINVSPGGVISVNEKTGVVVLTKKDIGLTNVDNTSDLNKPVSTAVKAELKKISERAPYLLAGWSYNINDWSDKKIPENQNVLIFDINGIEYPKLFVGKYDEINEDLCGITDTGITCKNKLSGLFTLTKDNHPYYKGQQLFIGGTLPEDFILVSDDAPVHKDLYDIDTKQSEYLRSFDANEVQGDWVSYTTSIFSGWGSYVGVIKNADIIKIHLIKRDDCPISKMFLVVAEMPNIDEVDLGEQNSPLYDDYFSSEILVMQDLFFETPITIDKDTSIEFVLNTPIKDNTKHLYMFFCADNYVSARIKTFSKQNYPDYPYNHNAWSGYSTGTNYESSKSRWKITNLSATVDVKENLTALKMIDFEYGVYSNIEHTQYIKPKGEGKFALLVDKVLEDRGISEKVEATYDGFNGAFSKEYYAGYDGIGTQNIEENKEYSFLQLTSTFTGIAQPIGIIPPEKPIYGVSFFVSPRNNYGQEVPLSKVWVELYQVNKLAEYSEGLQWGQLNPIRIGMASQDVTADFGEVKQVDLYFDEPIYNTGGKECYLAIHMDTYFNKVRNKPYSLVTTYCSNVDGKTYTSLDSYYTASKGETASWNRVWPNDGCIAWQFSKPSSRFVPGDSITNVVEQGLEEKVPEILSQIENVDAVRLAKQYYCVVGDTFQLFYQGVIRDFDYKALAVNILCPKGKAYTRYWEYTPTASETGSYKLKVQIRNTSGKIISQAETTIIVVSKPVLGDDDRLVLCFGDSLTAGGTWCGEGARRISGTNESILPAPVDTSSTGKLVLYGKKSATINGYSIGHEGYGGWTWASFLSSSQTSSTTNGIIITLSAAHGLNLNDYQKSVWTDNNNLNWELEDFPSTSSIKFNRGTGNTGVQSAITLPTSLSCTSPTKSFTSFTVTWESGNPFWDETTSSINFLNHATECGYSSGADYVACLLTWNGGGGASNGTFDYQSKINTQMTNATTLLRKLKTTMPSIKKVIVMGIQLPSVTGGSGANYGANGGYADMWGTVFYAFDYNKALEELVTNEEFGEYCVYVDTKAQFDTENMMPYEEKAKNTRTTETEIRGTNGVHPSTGGYYQIGDAFYRAMSYCINNEE